jgi:acyl carrier protein
MENKLKKIMSELFDIEVSEINENSSPDNIEKWDSLNQMNLIVSLEEEFNIVFTDDDIIEMVSYPLVKLILKNALHGE